MAPPDPGPIALPEAIRFVERARAAKLLPVHGWAYPASLLRQLVDQDGAEGVRMYLGMNDEGDPTLVLVAIDAAGNDLTQGVLMEYAWPCPPLCPDESPLGPRR